MKGGEERDQTDDEEIVLQPNTVGACEKIIIFIHFLYSLLFSCSLLLFLSLYKHLYWLV